MDRRYPRKTRRKSSRAKVILVLSIFQLAFIGKENMERELGMKQYILLETAIDKNETTKQLLVGARKDLCQPALFVGATCQI